MAKKKKKKKKKKGAGASDQNTGAATPADTTPTIPSDGTAADDAARALSDTKIADRAAGPTADAAVSGAVDDEAKVGDAESARPEARRHSIDAALKGAEVMARLTAKEAMRGVAKLAAETGVGVQEDHEQRALRRRVSVAAADLGKLVSAEMGAKESMRDVARVAAETGAMLIGLQNEAAAEGAAAAAEEKGGVRARFEAAGQGHVFKYFDGLGEVGQRALLRQAEAVDLSM